MSQAIVLAGGRGTRLRATVPDLPKPLAPVAGRPFLSHVLDGLAADGTAVVTLAVSFMHEKILTAFGHTYRGMELRYSVEHTPLGTGGAIALAFDRLDDGITAVVNGDTFQRAPFGKMRSALESTGAEICVAVVEVPETERFGAVTIENGYVLQFGEKRFVGPGFINAGAYVLRNSAVLKVGAGTSFSFEGDVLVPAAQSRSVVAVEAPGPFIDIGIPADYHRAQLLFQR